GAQLRGRRGDRVAVAPRPARIGRPRGDERSLFRLLPDLLAHRPADGARVGQPRRALAFQRSGSRAAGGGRPILLHEPGPRRGVRRDPALPRLLRRLRRPGAPRLSTVGGPGHALVSRAGLPGTDSGLQGHRSAVGGLPRPAAARGFGYNSANSADRWTVPPPPRHHAPMNILMVLPSYPPHWTGLTAYAKRGAEGLAARGHEVTVLTSRHLPELPLEERLEGVRVRRLPVSGRVSRGVLMPSLPTALWAEIRAHDLVQIHTPLMEAPLVTLDARLLRKPVVFTHHGDLVMPAGAFNRIIEKAVTTLMTQALRMATKITVHSEDYGRNSAFLSPFLHKLGFIYPPSDLPAPDRAAAARWKSDLGLDGRRLVGFAGRWVEEKGFDYLLQAVPRVVDSMPDAHFVYAGEPNIFYEDFFRRCQPYLDPVRD